MRTFLYYLTKQAYELTNLGRMEEQIFDHALSVQDFEEFTGIPHKSWSQAARTLYISGDWRYSCLEGTSRNQVFHQVISRLFLAPMKMSGPERENDWQLGWAENLQAYRDAKENDLDSLLPKYIRPGAVLRLGPEYIKTSDPMMLKSFVDLFSAIVFERFFEGCKTIHEFGCGTGYHLAKMAVRWPERNFEGYDWARSSQELLSLVASRHSFKLSGHHFNFFEPGVLKSINSESGVLTFGALEQVGARHSLFLESLLKQRPKVVVHIEGLDELYDRSLLHDLLADEYNQRRAYLTGLVNSVKALESSGRAKIHHLNRCQLGDLYNNTYSILVWSPK